MRFEPDDQCAGMIPAGDVSFPSQAAADQTIREMNTIEFSDELPDDLGLLSEQLGDDANRLAELYPARAPHFLPSVSNLQQVAAKLGSEASREHDALLRPMPAWMRWSAAAAVLVCALWGATGVVDNEPILVDFESPRGKVVDSAPRVSGATRVSVPPAPVSGEVYENLTAPAREALLDMWEAESFPQASLSI